MCGFLVGIVLVMVLDFAVYLVNHQAGVFALPVIVVAVIVLVNRFRWRVMPWAGICPVCKGKGTVWLPAQSRGEWGSRVSCTRCGGRGKPR